MNELSNEVNYGEMKAELQALRKKLEDLETEQAAFKSTTHPTVRRRFSKALIVAASSLGALLIGSGLLWSDDIKALFIDKDGVHINGKASIEPSTGPAMLQMRSGGGTLALQYKQVGLKHRIGFSDGVNPLMMFWSEYPSNNAFIRGNLGIGTEPDPNYALNVNSKAKVNGDLDLTGTGKLTAPSATVTGNLTAGTLKAGALDVKGEISGKPKILGTYGVSKMGAQAMTKMKSSVCFLTEVHGNMGTEDAVWISEGPSPGRLGTAENGGRWYLNVRNHSDLWLRGVAVCIGAPDDSW